MTTISTKLKDADAGGSGRDLSNNSGASKNFGISITHVGSDSTVAFKPFITGFTDSWSANYDSEEVLGRMDPIPTYKSTNRKITLDFEVVSFSLTEAKANLRKISALAQFMYPVVKAHGNALKVTSAPLLRVKFGNLIQTSRSEKGLLVTCDGFKYSPDFEGTNYYSGKFMYPKKVPMSFSFTVLHEEQIGFVVSTSKTTETAIPREKNYPYNINVTDASSEVSGAPKNTSNADKNKKANQGRVTKSK